MKSKDLKWVDFIEWPDRPKKNYPAVVAGVPSVSAAPVLFIGEVNHTEMEVVLIDEDKGY